MVAPTGRIQQEPLTNERFDAIKAQLAREHNGALYLLIVRLLRNTGLRVNEIMQLTQQSLGWDGPDGFIWIVRGKAKTKEWERKPIHPELMADLRAMGQIRKQGPIWPIKTRMIQHAFTTASQKALGRRYTLHQIRHLYGTDMLRQGVEPAIVAKLLGHADYRTTLAWYHDMSFEEKTRIARSVPI
jgi:integrase/recombinase XerD